eukprot:scaffold231_cov131-Isochrysis_galbana.AAC.4
MQSLGWSRPSSPRQELRVSMKICMHGRWRRSAQLLPQPDSCFKFVFQHCLSSLGHLFVLLGPGAGSVRQRPSGKKASQPGCPPKQGKEYVQERS